MNVRSTQTRSNVMALMQMTRIGDVIQTLQAARELKANHPNIKLIFIGREKFAGGLDFELAKIFDEIFLLNTKEFFNLPQEDLNLKNVTKNVKYFIDRINACDINVLINLSFSKSSSYFAGLIKATHKLGLVRDTSVDLRINDLWSQYVYSNVMGGSLNFLNLVDIFKNIIGVKSTSVFGVREDIESVDQNLITLHPFASSEKKRWNPNKWIEVIYQILKDNTQARIRIVGGREDIVPAQQIVQSPILIKFEGRLDSIAGQTNIRTLAHEIKKSRLFIGHDSMCGHLAAYYGVQTLTLSLGSVRPAETAPYGINNFVMAPRTPCFPCFPTDQCDFAQCHADISYHVLADLVSRILQNKEISHAVFEKSHPLHIKKVNIYRTRLDPNSGFQMSSVLDQQPLISEIFLSYYKIMWNFILSEKDDQDHMPLLGENTANELAGYLEGIKKLQELNDFGKQYSQYIIEEIQSATPNLVRIKDCSQRISEIDQLTLMLKRPYKYLAPVIDFYHTAKANLKGQGLMELAGNSYIAYNQANLTASVLYEMIEKNVRSYSSRRPDKGHDVPTRHSVTNN